MRVLVRVVLVLVVGAILVGSLASGTVRWPPGVSPGVSHLLAYAVLGGLMALALGRTWRGVLVAFCLTVAIGTGVEVLQLFVPVRTFSFYDMGMNLAGATVGVGVGVVLRWVGVVSGRGRQG